ncbi:MAG: hypothetical protein Q9225_004589 [Loekoesia sp. 1 TL-2023]
MTTDPLDELFELENTFYKEGYDLGTQDGSRSGRIEGRLFGLEKGFEKYITMGRLHGRSVIWSGRLSSSPGQSSEVGDLNEPSSIDNNISSSDKLHARATDNDLRVSNSSLPRIPYNPRLEKHLRTLYALTEPASLSTENSEEAVSEFDDRLKRAEGKVKIVEKLIGEGSVGDRRQNALEEQRGTRQHTAPNGDEGIEDINVLRARH